jgi:hypothetical protein
MTVAKRSPVQPDPEVRKRSVMASGHAQNQKKEVTADGNYVVAVKSPDEFCSGFLSHQDKADF